MLAKMLKVLEEIRAGQGKQSSTSPIGGGAGGRPGGTGTPSAASPGGKVAGAARAGKANVEKAEAMVAFARKLGTAAEAAGS